MVDAACQLLGETGLFGAELSLFELDSDVETPGAEVYLAVPTAAPYVTCAVPDPFDVLQYLLVHPPLDLPVPVHLLPLRQGLELRHRCHSRC